MGVDLLVALPLAGRLDLERRHMLAVEQYLHLVRLAQTLDVFIAVPGEPDLDVVVAVPRHGVRNPQAAARPEWKAQDMVFLRLVGGRAEGVATGRRGRPSDGRPGNLLR